MFGRAATRVVALDRGSALFYDRLPRHPDLNTVRVEVPAPATGTETPEPRAMSSIEVPW